MSKFKSVAFGALAMLAASSAQAAVTVVFQDNFNAETPGLNQTSFTNWSVLSGAVDVVPIGQSFQFLPNSFGLYIDLDGTTPNTNPASVFATNMVFGPGKYTLEFDMAGSQRPFLSTINTVRVTLGDFSQDVTLTDFTAATHFSFTFTTLSGGALSFSQLMKSDFRGLLLDNVQVTAVPEPATWAMMLIGFAGLGYAARRRQLAGA